MMKLFYDLDVYAFRKGWPRFLLFFVPLFYPSTWPIIVYRFGNYISSTHLSIIRYPLYLVYFFFKRISEILTGIEISEHATIGHGFFIAHIGSIVISHDTKIGCYASFHQGVTIGVSGKESISATIGDYVYFGAGSKIIGDVHIGNKVVIGANAVVTSNIPDNAVVAGIPAKVINYEGSNDYIHYRNKP
jgi:serine O-acetyltransferase